MRTTRRAAESVSVCGDNGGKSVWNDFIRSGIWGGVVGEGVGKEAKTNKGGLKYSMPILRALLDMFRISFTRLYLSTLKLSVGPAANLIILNEGAIGVSVKASRCVTCSAGAIVR